MRHVAFPVSMARCGPVCALALGLALGGLGPVACDSRDPAADAIQSAKTALATLTGGGRTVDTRAERLKPALDEVVRLLTPHAGSAQPGHAAAANALLARAKAGLATLMQEEANAAEQAAMNKALEVRGKLDEWLVQQARAGALATFDPTKARGEIEARIAALTGHVAAATQERARAEAVVAGLKSKAQGLLDRAKVLREEASRVRAGAADTSATAGLVLVQRAAEIGREADELDKQASFTQADAQAAQPQADTAAARIVQLSNELDQARTALSELEATTVATRAQGQAARAAADAAAAETAKLSSELAEMRGPGTALARASDAAAAGLREAVAAALKAAASGGGMEAATAAKLAAAGYRQALGDVHYVRARGLTDYAALLSHLGGSRPALPEAATYAQQARGVAEQAAAAVKEAQEAYEEARSAYAGTGGREETRAAVEKLAALVATLSGKKEEAPVDAAPAGDGTPAPADAPVAEAPPADAVAAVKAAFLQQIAHRKAGDEAKVLAWFILKDDTQRELVLAEMKMGAAADGLDAACREKLNKGLKELAEEAGPEGMMLRTVLAQMEPSLDALEFTQRGPEEVGIVSKTMPTPPLTARLVDGVWRTEFPVLPDAMVQQARMMTPMLVGAFGAVAQEVRAGTIADGKALAVALMSRLTPGGAPASGDMNK